MSEASDEMDDIRRQVQELRKDIELHNYHYYTLDAPIIPDVEYDKLFRELQELEQRHPELVTPDSPTQRVGAAALKQFAQIQHHTPMLSLGNAFDAAEVEAFDRRVRQMLRRGQGGICGRAEVRRSCSQPLLREWRFDDWGNARRRLCWRRCDPEFTYHQIRPLTAQG